MYTCRSVRLQRGDSEEKQLSVTFPVLVTEVTNLSASIWFTGERHCTVFRHVMQLSLFGLVLEKHFDGEFTADQEKDITFKHWPPEYQS